MTILFEDEDNIRPPKEFKSVSEAVESHLEQTSYYAGEHETVKEVQANVKKVVCNTIELLVDKGLITEEELKTKVLSGLYI